MKRISGVVVMLVVALALSGCQGMGGTQYPPEIRQGKIEQISIVQISHPHQFGVGAILGGAAGAGLGSLIGAGTGRDVAIAVGAIAGAVGGQYAQNKYDSSKSGQQIVVRLNSGVLIVVTQPTNPTLFVGQNVYVQTTGAEATVVPQNAP